MAALLRALRKAKRPTVLAREVADELAPGDRSLPLAHWASGKTANLLKGASLAGLVVQYRRGGRSGISLWGLPGGEAPAGFTRVVNEQANFDKATLAALRRAVKKEGGQVRIATVLQELGHPSYSKAFESRVAQSLVRLEWRQEATSVGAYPLHWKLR